MDKSSNSDFNPNSNFLRTTNVDYGQEWIVDDAKSLQELGENEIKLRYLEKSLKSKRRIEQRNAKKVVPEPVEEVAVLNKTDVAGRKFPFKADEFRYPNDDKEKYKSLYIKYSEDYGSKKPNDLELPEKYFPIDDNFSKGFHFNMHKNHSLNTAQSKSKVHKNLDSVV